MSITSQFALNPRLQTLASRVGIEAAPLIARAEKVWDLHPAETAPVPPAYFLPQQIERISGWSFTTSHPRIAMEGGKVSTHGATRAFLVRDLLLIDGKLIKGLSCVHLHASGLRSPVVRITAEIDEGALYSTAGGIRYFGQWLLDDCLTYPLAAQHGTPIAPDTPGFAHTAGYEERLGMAPARHSAVRIKKAILFDDVGQNSGKRRRSTELRATLLKGHSPTTHPGVFIVRGLTGERRLLRNELELADHLARTRGFRVLHPIKHSVQDIIAACAGAETIIGVEGSGLIHGIALQPAGGRLLTLQPPNRFVSLYKDVTDRDGKFFGFVVGTPMGNDFVIDRDEVERTLDLLPAFSSTQAA